MKILDRYIIYSFTLPFIYGLLAFTGILILTEWLGMIETPTLITIKYLSLRVPCIFFEITPCAVLLATIFGLNTLIMHGEITAISQAGFGIIRISIPILIISLCISIISLLFTGFIKPIFNSWANKIKQEEIEMIDPKTKMYGVSLLSKGKIYHFGTFDNELKEISKITITKIGPRDLPILRIDAESARYEGGEWYLIDGLIHKLNEDGEEVAFKRFKRIKGMIEERPDEIWKILNSKKKRSEDLTILELLDYIRLLESSGGIFRDRLTDLYLKFSLPMTNLTIAVIGIFLSFSLGHKGRGKISGLGIALIVSFLYWGMTAVGQALGHAGALPPALAAWMANLVAIGSIMTICSIRRMFR